MTVNWKCENCRFVLARPRPGGAGIAYEAFCRRWPKDHIVPLDHWCGEFREGQQHEDHRDVLKEFEGPE